jgi:hypothetical protein
MNITKACPDQDLQVYIVENVISDSSLTLLTRMMKGHLPTGYKQDEIDQALADIRAASIQACEETFGLSGLVATKENSQWPWFDLHVGEGRTAEQNGIYDALDMIKGCYAEFCIIPSTVGGELTFNNGDCKIELKPGQLVIGPQLKGHSFTIEPIVEGSRFTLLTFMQQ